MSPATGSGYPPHVTPAGRLAKILRVAPILGIKLTLEGVLRDRRMQGAELPIDVFRSFCSLMPWCRVDAEQVYATGELPQEDETDSNELLKYCRVLKEQVRHVATGSVAPGQRTWSRKSELRS